MEWLFLHIKAITSITCTLAEFYYLSLKLWHEVADDMHLFKGLSFMDWFAFISFWKACLYIYPVFLFFSLIGPTLCPVFIIVSSSSSLLLQSKQLNKICQNQSLEPTMSGTWVHKSGEMVKMHFWITHTTAVSLPPTWTTFLSLYL